MRYLTSFFAIALMLLASGLLYWLFQKRASALIISATERPELAAAVEEAMESKKLLSKYDPARETVYREDFQRLLALRNSMRVIQHNSAELENRFRLAHLGILLLVLLPAAGWVILRERRLNHRLQALHRPLQALAAGEDHIAIGETRRDTIGRFARMIESASNYTENQRKQVRSLQHLQGWQEAARRHAHEIRTPLQAAWLETEALGELCLDLPERQGQRLAKGLDGILDEMRCLKRFTGAFTSFARLPEPQLVPEDLNGWLQQFAQMFETSWPNLSLIPPQAEAPVMALMDREMLRQVLVNLCTNSHLALGTENGEVRMALTGTTHHLQLRMCDSGPGIPPALKERIFQPYVTTRAMGEGMGLGLAISRKIMLDHGGDLILEDTSRGASFLLYFQRPDDSSKETTP